MKKLLLLILFFTGLVLNSEAQTTSRTVIDKNSIVKDTEGNILPYIIWTKLMQSGEYGLKPVNGGVEFVVYHFTPEEAKLNAERKQAMISKMEKPRSSDAFVEGEKFKGSRFTSIDKLKFDIKPNDGKIYVLNFWFINCPPCKQEIPELNDMVSRYKDKSDVVFIAVALDDKVDLKEFLKKSPFLYNIVADGRFFTEKYGVKSYPTHVVVGKDGLIKFSTLGLAPNTVHWINKVIQEQLTPPVNGAGD